MVPIIFLLFVAVPIIEIALLIQVGSFIGTVPTIAIVILTAILGTWLLRQQGLATYAKVQHRLQSGEMPATQIVEGLLLLVGGALLLTPGFVTDAIGFSTLIPFSRHWLAKWLTRRSGGWFYTATTVGGAGAPGNHARSGTAGGSAPHGGEQPRSGEILEGEFRREDRT